MKKQKLICILMSLALVVSAVAGISFAAFAGEVSYAYDAESATLTVKGTGEIADYTEGTIKSRPWNVYKDETKHIVIGDGITAVGDYAFAQFKYVQSVEIPESVVSLGTAAFVGADSLSEITVPDSVTTVEDYAFGYNENIEVPQGFIAHCSTKSAAQAYCFKNHIPFDSPMQDNQATAHITYGGERQFWSFVPLTDGTLTFSSSGSKDTFALLYDAETYVYLDTTSISELKRNALVYNDDNGNDVNFKLTYKVTAGKRYYLAARFRTNNVYDGSRANENGKFGVALNFTCSEHRYELSATTEPTCTEFGYNTYTCIACGNSYKESIMPLGHSYKAVSIDGDTVSLQCVRGDDTSAIGFADNYHSDITDENKALDVNGDGVINAKDYAILYKK